MHELTLVTVASGKNPLRREKYKDNARLDLHGIAPLNIVFQRGIHCVLFDGQEIGNLQIRAEYDEHGKAVRHNVLATLYDTVPQPITQAIYSRLRPYAYYVGSKHEDALIREQAIMDNMLDRIGPIDSAKVKTVYDGPARDLEALMFPGMIEYAIGPEFLFKKTNSGSYDRYEFLCVYKEDDVEIPAFRILYERPESVEIWGRGDREKARYGFVSDALRDAGRIAAETAADPDMLNDARGLLAMLPEEARERHRTDDIKNVRKKSSLSPKDGEFNYGVILSAASNTLMIPSKSVAFGEGFTVLSDFSYSKTNMRVLHRGRPIMDDRTGFIPGIPEPEMILIVQGAVMAMSEIWPEFRERHADESLCAGFAAREPVAITERLLQEFGPA